MNILVTGGAGYIGSHTAKFLARAGLNPVVLDDFSTGNREAVRWGPVERGTLSDRAFLRRIFDTYKFEGVIHFAANAYVGESISHPRKYFRNNVVGALNLLEEIQDFDVKYFVFSSSCTVYGIPSALPVSEEHPLRPISPYGESKLFIERALRWYGEAYGLRWAALRYFNAAGADEEGEAGEHHDPETHLIPLAIQSALGQIPHVDILGTDYPTPDGTAIRDYVHVCDLADAHIGMLNYLRAGGANIALNLGSGKGHSVREVIKAVERVSGHAAACRVRPRRDGDPPCLVADASQARQVLGWRPRRSELDNIVETALRWHTRDDRSELWKPRAARAGENAVKPAMG